MKLVTVQDLINALECLPNKNAIVLCPDLEETENVINTITVGQDGSDFEGQVFLCNTPNRSDETIVIEEKG